ncbi:DnaB-like helicase C-terminal domain-containing protein [Desulfomonile tiedjei]|uniref:DnaB-like helicase C-terminal domain-containing protein n=1 Tax=Desulfomonile tiedjei TaxID=2358 RepID=UPI0009FEAA24
MKPSFGLLNRFISNVSLVHVPKSSQSNPGSHCGPPCLADLRESGAIEQDANVVLGLFRKGYYNDSVTDTTASCLILKNRSGPCGEVKLYWDEGTATFKPLTNREDVCEDSRTMSNTELKDLHHRRWQVINGGLMEGKS